MNNIFNVTRDTCLVCRQPWCTCNVQWSVRRIEDCTNDYLQEVISNCFECGVLPEENSLVQAIAMELVHRTRYNLNPAKRFTGETNGPFCWVLAYVGEPNETEIVGGFVEDVYWYIDQQKESQPKPTCIEEAVLDMLERRIDVAKNR